MDTAFRATLWRGWFLITTSFLWIHNWFRFAFTFRWLWFGTCFLIGLNLLLFILVLILIFSLALFFIQTWILVWWIWFLLHFDLTYILWEFFWTVDFIDRFKIWIWDILIEFFLVFIVLYNYFIFFLKIHFINYIINLINFYLSYFFFVKNLLYLLKFLI